MGGQAEGNRAVSLAAGKLLLLGAWLLLLGVASGFGPPTFGDGDPFVQPMGSAELASLGAMPPVPGTVRAVAAVVMDGASGHTLVSRNADARLAPASLTKMMTALVALDRASLSEPIVATERSRSEPSVIGLDPGDTLSLESMLYGLLLMSGNDAAQAIAESIGGGSIERFVGWMNERAATMGLKNTRFANPSGLDQAGHYSSARDMAEIARAVMAEPRLAQIVGTRRHVIEGPPLYVFTNSNPLLGSYPGLDGVKTGFTDDAGRCFAASVTRDGGRLITVVLNSPNIAGEAFTLLEAGFAISRPVPLSVARVGYAGLREAVQPQLAGPVANLAGWELPFLRAFTRRMGDNSFETTVSLAGRPLGRWR